MPARSSCDAPPSHLLERIYWTIHAPEAWGDLVQNIGDWLEADCGLMISPSIARLTAVPIFAFGLDMTPIMAAYPKHAGRAEFTTRALATGRAPGAFLLDELMPPHERPTNAFWQDMVAPAGLTSGIFTVVRTPDEGDRPVVLNYYRRAPKPAYTSNDVAKVEALLPHLRRALAVSLDSPPRQELSPATGLYDALGAPCFLLDQSGCVVHANPAAQQLIAAQDGITLRGGRIKIWDERVDVAFQNALDRMVSEPWSGRWRTGHELLARRPSQGAAMVIVLTAITFENPIAAVSSPAQCAMLVLEEKLRPNHKIPDRLRRLYSLTDAEIDVVIRLADGAAPAKIASDRATSRDTVRVQIKSAMNKTDTHRQADLVALVNRLQL